MKIGIYGGTFNPIHIGHLHIADAAIKALELDKVVFIPAKNSYMKDSREVAPYSQRYTMIMLAIYGNDRFELRDDDVMGEEPTYTSITVQNMRAEYPEDELYLILGEDSYVQLEKWHEPNIIFNCVDGAFVYRRTDAPHHATELMNMYPAFTKVAVSSPLSNINISSTMVRYQMKNGYTYRYLVPEEVYDYITIHNLYNTEAK